MHNGYFSIDKEGGWTDKAENNQANRDNAERAFFHSALVVATESYEDWAVLVEEDGAERLYFVVETKGGLFADDLRDKEKAQVTCGTAHFKALELRESPAKYIVARSVDNMLGHT